ncbi:MAG: phosphoenolpyruvate--protein phosphotransferase [candidate division KSB1 bacterium]|nr:phosphoenolpyruvate--protein phosphotransferase [candidate division KSB1 bacterium]
MAKAAKEIRLQGVAASPGVVIGPVRILTGEVAMISRRTIEADQAAAEMERLMQALNQSSEELEIIYQQTSAAYSPDAAQIFRVHQAMLSDPMVIDECRDMIQKERVGAEYAFSEVMDRYIEKLSALGDEMFRARHADVRDLKRRVLHHLLGSEIAPIVLEEPSIIFARELTPSDTVHLERGKVLGFAMDFGARTSHATILARSINVPAVVGLKEGAASIKDGDWAILDGSEGVLILNPTPVTEAFYRKRREKYLDRLQRLEKLKDLPARTLDGKNIELACNIEFIEEAESVIAMGGDGVGLFRTEYLFLSGAELPTEERQVEEYTRLAKAMKGKPLIIRTFDLGGDKLPPFITLPPEQNPFLGVRGVRLYFNGASSLFRTQLRAIYRAGLHGDIRIMLPMITSVEEIIQCRRIIAEIQEELRREKLPFAEQLPLGAMIEVPAAAVVADLIAKECDFLSIGTNDLVQYTVAVDRGNPHLLYLYQPYHPAVFRLIAGVIQKAHEQGVWVGMCGEMAGDPLVTMILIGMGLDEFSVSPGSLPYIKEIIRNVSVEECEEMVAQLFELASIDKIQRFLNDSFRRKFSMEMLI